MPRQSFYVKQVGTQSLTLTATVHAAIEPIANGAEAGEDIACDLLIQNTGSNDFSVTADDSDTDGILVASGDSIQLLDQECSDTALYLYNASGGSTALVTISTKQ